MADQDTINEFWKAFLSSQPEFSPWKNASIPPAWQFGLGDSMAQELADLVVAGEKRATASLFWEYERGDEMLPKPGDLSIILDGKNTPVCLIETTAVQIVPFNQVNERFAAEEGEGDKTLHYWKKVHWRFFKNITCPEIGRKVSQIMPVVCEEFRKIYPV